MIKRIFLMGFAVLACHGLVRATEAEDFVHVPLVKNQACQTDDPKDDIDVTELLHYCQTASAFQQNLQDQLESAEKNNVAMEQKIALCQGKFSQLQKIINAQQKRILKLNQKDKNWFEFCTKIIMINYMLIWSVANASLIKKKCDALSEVKLLSNRVKRLKTIAGIMTGLLGVWFFYRYGIRHKDVTVLFKTILNYCKQKFSRA